MNADRRELHGHPFEATIVTITQSRLA